MAPARSVTRPRRRLSGRRAPGRDSPLATGQNLRQEFSTVSKCLACGPSSFSLASPPAQARPRTAMILRRLGGRGLAKIKAEIEGQLPSGRCAIEDKTGDEGERQLRSVGDSPSDVGTRSQGWDKNVERARTTCNERSHETSCSLWIRPCLRLSACADVVRLNAATNLGTPRVGRTTRC